MLKSCKMSTHIYFNYPVPSCNALRNHTLTIVNHFSTKLSLVLCWSSTATIRSNTEENKVAKVRKAQHE